MKAVVLEVREGEAALLTMDGTVRRVRGDYRVGQELEYAPRPRFSYIRWVAAALVAAILLTASAGLWIGNNYVACAEVSLDVNPAIVYTLNRRSRVLSVSAVNEDATAIVAAIGQEDVRFMPIEDAVEKTLDVLENKGYLDSAEENYVLAGVSADDSAIQDDLAGRVEAVMARPRAGAAPVSCQIERTDRDTAKKAREKGMTPGRYALWQSERDGGEPEDFAKRPVREILGHGEPEAPKAGEDQRPDADRETPASQRNGGEENPLSNGPDDGSPEPPMASKPRQDGQRPAEGTAESPEAGGSEVESPAKPDDLPEQSPERDAESPGKAEEPPEEAPEKETDRPAKAENSSKKEAESPGKAEKEPEESSKKEVKSPAKPDNSREKQGEQGGERSSGRSDSSRKSERGGGSRPGGGPGGRR